MCATTFGSGAHVNKRRRVDVRAGRPDEGAHLRRDAHSAHARAHRGRAVLAAPGVRAAAVAADEPAAGHDAARALEARHACAQRAVRQP